jgi:hypothetical protein
MQKKLDREIHPSARREAQTQKKPSDDPLALGR